MLGVRSTRAPEADPSAPEVSPGSGEYLCAGRAFRLKSASRGADVVIAGALVAVWLVAASPWVYRNGMGEPDSLAMAVGAYQAILGGLGLTEPMLYAPQGHPLYYGALISVGRWRQWTIDQLIGFMNMGSWLATGLAIGTMYVLAREFTDRMGALAVTVAMASSPVVLEVGSYGHPVTVALLLFLVAALVEIRGHSVSDGSSWWKVTRSACALFLFLAALENRADVGLLFLVVPVLTFWATDGSWRETAWSGAVVGSSMLGYLGVGRLLALGGVESVDVLAFVQDNYWPALLLRGAAKWVHVASIGSIVALGIGTACVLVRREWRYLAAGALMVGPTLAFYLGNPFPSRHFLHAVVGGCLFGALLWRRLMPHAGLAPWALIGMVGGANLFAYLPLGALTSGVVRHVDVQGARRLGESVWERHRLNEAFLAWDRERWTTLLPDLSDGCLVAGGWTGLAHFTTVMSRREGRIALVDRLGNGRVLELRAANRSVVYAGWSPGEEFPRTLPNGACVIVTIRLSEEAKRVLPPSTRLSLPPADLEWFPL